MNPTIELLRAHRSIRKFTDQPIDDQTLIELVKAGQAASSSSFIQAYTLIDVVDPEVRDALALCAGNQRYIREAARFIVFCGDVRRLSECTERYQKEAQLGFTEQLLTAAIDCGLVAQNLVTAAESLGIGACYIGAIRNQPAQVTEILRLPQQVIPLFGLCLGYPDQSPGIKPRLPTDVILHQNQYDASRFASHFDEYETLTSNYYRDRTNGKITSGWGQQMAEKMENESRPMLLKFLRDQGFAQK